MSSNGKYIGLTLAISSNFFIGVSYVITKRGLINSEGHGEDSYSYLKNRMWWMGTITMVLGELANFAAYSFAPAILVTPLGALSVIISAILAHFFLNEKLQMQGRVGSALCIIGASIIVLHAPDDIAFETVNEIIQHASNAGFIIYTLLAISTTVFLIKIVAPKYGREQVIVYVSICSLMGSLSVMACKGFGVALKLTFSGSNQFIYPSTYFFIISSAICIVIQLKYFNKALDLYSTAIVTPIYYVCFTTATIVASVALFGTLATDSHQLISSLSGFCTLFIGVFLLSNDKESNNTMQILNSEGEKTALGSRIAVADQSSIKGEDRNSISIRKSSQIGYPIDSFGVDYGDDEDESENLNLFTRSLTGKNRQFAPVSQKE